MKKICIDQIRYNISNGTIYTERQTTPTENALMWAFYDICQNDGFSLIRMHYDTHTVIIRKSLGNYNLVLEIWQLSK